MSNNFTITTLILTKFYYDSEKLRDEEKRGRDHEQLELIDKKRQKSEWT